MYTVYYISGELTQGSPTSAIHHWHRHDLCAASVVSVLKILMGYLCIIQIIIRIFARGFGFATSKTY